MQKFIFLLAGFFSSSAFAGRAIVMQDIGSEKKVIVQSERQENGISRFTFFSCSSAGELEQIDLQQCRPFVGGRSFTMAQTVTALMNNGGRHGVTQLMTDGAYGVRAIKRSIRGENFDTLNETTYMGSGNGYNLAQNSDWLMNSLERSLTGTGNEPGMKLGYAQGSKTFNGDYEAGVEGLTAILLYAQP